MVGRQADRCVQVSPPKPAPMMTMWGWVWFIYSPRFQQVALPLFAARLGFVLDFALNTVVLGDARLELRVLVYQRDLIA